MEAEMPTKVVFADAIGHVRQRDGVTKVDLLVLQDHGEVRACTLTNCCLVLGETAARDLLAQLAALFPAPADTAPRADASDRSDRYLVQIVHD